MPHAGHERQHHRVDGLAGDVRAAEPGAVKRIGDDPVIVPLTAEGGGRVEVAAAGIDRHRALGPLAASVSGPPRSPSAPRLAGEGAGG